MSSQFIQCRTLIGDKALAEELFGKYVKEKVFSLSKIMPEIKCYAGKFGCDSIEKHVLPAIASRCSESNLNEALGLAVAFWETMGAVQTTSSLAKIIVEHVVQGISPSNLKECLPLKARLKQETVRLALNMFVGPHAVSKDAAVAGDFIKAVNWISCQEHSVPTPSYDRQTDRQPEVGKGPTVLLEAGLHQLCDHFGWTAFEQALMDVFKSLCEKGSQDCAIALFKELSSPLAQDGSSGQKSRVCSRWGDIVFAFVLGSGIPMSTSAMVALFELIESASPTHQGTFINDAKQLDARKELYALAVALHKKGHGNKAVTELTEFCAQQLTAKLIPVTASVESSFIPSTAGPAVSRNTVVASFLSSPCKHTLDFPLRKADHAMTAASLRGLMNSSQIKFQSYQPLGRGAWFVRITKVKRQSVLATAVNCTCSSSQTPGYYHSPTSSTAIVTGECILKPYKTAIEQFKKDLHMRNKLIKLLPSALRSKIQRPVAPAVATLDLTVAHDSPDKHKAPPLASAVAKKPKPDEVKW